MQFCHLFSDPLTISRYNKFPMGIPMVKLIVDKKVKIKFTQGDLSVSEMRRYLFRMSW